METTPDARLARSVDPTSASPFDPVLVEAVAREAACDAEAVALFLHQFGFVPTAERPIRLPARFLLHMGAALRLLAWEEGGLRIHRDEGLPAARSAIIDAFARYGPSPGEAPSAIDFARQVFALFVERFAWHGRRDLEADVLLGDLADEDALVDAVAEVLWRARHARGPQPGKEASDG